MFLLTGVKGGVTHMLFSSDGNLLFTGYRKVHVHVIEYLCKIHMNNHDAVPMVPAVLV